jgi:CRP-like cAMP-binding protein
MRADLLEHDLVALLEDTPVKHFQTGEPLILRRGQLGTIVMVHADGAVEVEFADRDGRAYALLPITRNRLMLLRDAPDHAVA